MSRQSFIFAIVGFAIVCGLFHPWLGFVFFFVTALEGALFFGFTPLVFMFSSLIFSTACIAAAGIPAAIYEHVTGNRQTNEVSLWIWLLASALIALPAFGNFFRFGF
jgi:hypothetical protein